MLNLRIVMDTNVFVSALLKNPSIPALIVETIMDFGKIVVVYNDDIYTEYFDVLNRKRLNLPQNRVCYILDYILKHGEKVVAFSQDIHFDDESDKKFYDVFKTASADYLITGNVKHFPEEEKIVTPKNFTDLLKTVN